MGGGNDVMLVAENEKLKLSLSYKDMLLEQKDREIAALKENIALLKKQLKNYL